MKTTDYNVTILTPDKRDEDTDGLLYDRAFVGCCEHAEDAIRQARQWVRDSINGGKYRPTDNPVLIRLTMFCEVNI